MCLRRPGTDHRVAEAAATGVPLWERSFTRDGTATARNRPSLFAADWIEDLYGRATTGGCSSSPLLYRPGASNTRGQMAVFLTKTFELP